MTGADEVARSDRCNEGINLYVTAEIASECGYLVGINECARWGRCPVMDTNSAKPYVAKKLDDARRGL